MGILNCTEERESLVGNRAEIDFMKIDIQN